MKPQCFYEVDLGVAEWTPPNSLSVTSSTLCVVSGVVTDLLVETETED